MSWIADIAGRAENILNHIDKNAANVLQQTSIRLSEEWATNKKSETKSNVSTSAVLSNFSAPQPEKVVADSTIKNSEITPLISIEVANEIDVIKPKKKYKKRNIVTKNFCDKNPANEQKEELSKYEPIKGVITVKRNLKDEDAGDKEEYQWEEKILQLENMLKHTTDEKNCITYKFKESSISNNIYVDTISELEMSLKKSQKQYVEIAEKLNWQTKESGQIRSELDNYRKKAQNTLQLKDEIIERLKNNATNTVKYEENIFDFEINSLREENSMKTNELQNKICELENREILINQLNQKISDLKIKYQNTVSSLTNRCKLDQGKSIQLESQNKVINQEINTLRREMHKQNQLFLQELHEKENEIMMLQSKESKINENSELNSTEGKIKSLTQVLFEKQAAVETLTVEKNALKLQLEQVQEQLHYVITLNRPHRTEIVNVNDTDDDKSQLPLILKENPFDTQVARRVKRAYTSFDSAGIRIGVFLRRYPLIRIMVFVYIALLHIWVIFVLLSTTPT